MNILNVTENVLCSIKNVHGSARKVLG